LNSKAVVVKGGNTEKSANKSIKSINRVKRDSDVTACVVITFFCVALIIAEFCFSLLPVSVIGDACETEPFCRSTIALTCCACAVAIALLPVGDKRVYIIRFIAATLVFAVIAFVVFLYLQKAKRSGYSVQSVKKYLHDCGRYSIPAFILLQILQVVILPLPGIVSIAAGACVFGSFWGGFFSFIGISAGSFIAFFTGRLLGKKAVTLLVGKNTLDRISGITGGRDKLLLSVMFLLPFFPDDALCFISGITDMTVGYFSVVMLISRLISSFVAAYFIGGVPLDSPLGIAVWCCVIVLAALASAVIIKMGDKLPKWFLKLMKNASISPKTISSEEKAKAGKRVKG